MSEAETLDPRAPRRKPPPVPVLWHVFDGERLQVASEFRVLEPGEHKLGRDAEQVDLCFNRDPRVSRHHADLTVSATEVVLENRSRHGVRVGGRTVERAVLRAGDILRLGDSLFTFRFQPRRLPDVPIDNIIGASPETAHVRAEVQLVARANSTVLVLGESGVGKEEVARALHALSGRAGAFVAVNCGALPDALAESQLFGHEKGAFTGADKASDGFFRAAEGGTLFLDELGELPPQTQPKLLRALDRNEILPVGRTEPVAADVRIIAATNRDLGEDMDSGEFRGDLYARVAEVSLRLPPLRERPEDILPLFELGLGDPACRLSPDLAEQLLLARWPFNVREVLKVAAEAGLRTQGAEMVELETVEDWLQLPGDGDAPQDDLDEYVPSREELAELLKQYGGVVSKLARARGRSRTQVYRWLRQYDMNPADYRA